MAAEQPDDRRDRPAQLAAVLVRFRRWRERILPRGLDGEPAWDLLLILYADKDSVRYSATMLAKAASASFSTAHAQGSRVAHYPPDLHHANRPYACLSDRGEHLMTSCLHGFEAQ